MSARTKWVAGALALAAVGAVWLLAARSGRHSTESAAATPAPQDEARLVRRDYPRIADGPAAARPDAGSPSAATAGAYVPPQAPPAARVIKVGGDGPTASPQLASAWATDYRDAVCACRTRTCVGALQGAFIRRLGAIVHGDEADDDKYSEATHAAIGCYYALPEGS